MSKPTDTALVVQAAVAGSRQAFGELVSRYQSSVRRFFLNQTLGDGPLSDDLAQDTFVKAWLNIGSFRGLASFSTWLMRIAYNVFYDYCRRSERREVNAESLEDHPHDPQHASQESRIDPGQRAVSAETRLDLYAALSQLKPDERTCVTLQLIDGYDIRRVSHITGMKEGTVKSHLSRGKEKMATFLRANGYERR